MAGQPTGGRPADGGRAASDLQDTALKVLLEAKSQGLVSNIEPVINHLNDSGRWISKEVKQRILVLASEADKPKTG